MKKCYIYNGDVEPEHVSVECEWNGKKMIIEDVPAEVCEQCGERYFDGETTLRMEKSKSQRFLDEQTAQIPASIRDLKNLSYLEKGNDLF